MASYEQILRLLRYRNWHTRALLDRKFKLVCSELNGRYVSNEFQVEVSVTGPGSSVWLQARESPPYPTLTSASTQEGHGCPDHKVTRKMVSGTGSQLPVTSGW